MVFRLVAFVFLYSLVQVFSTRAYPVVVIMDDRDRDRYQDREVIHAIQIRTDDPFKGLSDAFQENFNIKQTENTRLSKSVYGFFMEVIIPEQEIGIVTAVVRSKKRTTGSTLSREFVITFFPCGVIHLAKDPNEISNLLHQPLFIRDGDKPDPTANRNSGVDTWCWIPVLSDDHDVTETPVIMKSDIIPQSSNYGFAFPFDLVLMPRINHHAFSWYLIRHKKVVMTNTSDVISFFFDQFSVPIFSALSNLIEKGFNMSSKSVDETNKRVLEIQGVESKTLFTNEPSEEPHTPTRSGPLVTPTRTGAFGGADADDDEKGIAVIGSPGEVKMAGADPSYREMLMGFLAPEARRTRKPTIDALQQLLKPKIASYAVGSLKFSMSLITFEAAFLIQQVISLRALNSQSGGLNLFLDTKGEGFLPKIEEARKLDLFDSFKYVYSQVLKANTTMYIQEVLSQIVVVNPEFKKINFRTLCNVEPHASYFKALVQVAFTSSVSSGSADNLPTVIAIREASRHKSGYLYFAGNPIPEESKRLDPYPWREVDIPPQLLSFEDREDPSPLNEKLVGREPDSSGAVVLPGRSVTTTGTGPSYSAAITPRSRRKSPNRSPFVAAPVAGYGSGFAVPNPAGSTFDPFDKKFQDVYSAMFS